MDNISMPINTNQFRSIKNRRDIKLETDYIEEVVRDVSDEDWNNVEKIVTPRGEKGVNLVHLASYKGRLEVLERAVDTGVDLSIIDMDKRCALHHAAAQGHVEVVKWLVGRSTADQLELQDSNGKTPLHLAALNTRVEVVRILVDAGVNVNIYDKHNMTPLHLAWFNVNCRWSKQVSRYEKIVNIIVTSPGFRKIDDTSQESVRSLVLNQAVDLNSIPATKQLLNFGLTIPKDFKTLRTLMLPLHIAAARGFDEMLCFLLDRNETKWMIDIREEHGNTPLHVAVIERMWSCARILIENNGNLLTESNGGRTVIDDLFLYNPNPLVFLTDILDDCLEVSDPINNCKEIYLNFKVLAPEDEQRQMVVVSALIAKVLSMEEMNILQHPLIEAFFEVKWKSLRIFFLILAGLQTSFLFWLITYSMMFLQNESSSSAIAWILFACAVIQLCYNVLQFITKPKYYMRRVETWLSILSAGICVIIVIAEESSLCNSSMGSASSWTIQSTGFVMLFSCIQMMFTIGGYPPCESYPFMFITVLKTVFKVFLSVSCIVLGFILSFLVLFHSNNDFSNPWKAFVKTIVMMTGEYEYSNLFPSTERKNSSVDSLNSNESESFFLTYISSIVFLAFVFLTSIAVMNLITGLAVSDTQAILNEGFNRRLMKQAELLNHIELITSHRKFESCLIFSKLRSWVKSKNHSETKLTVKCFGEYLDEYRCRGPEELSNRLLKCIYNMDATKRNLRQESQTTSCCENLKKDFTGILQKEFNKLRLEMNSRNPSPET